jgi:hypothetical protein
VVREPREQLQDPFLRHGKVTVDLGTDLTQRWLQAGGKGRGFQRVGETQFVVTDPNGAAFEGLAPLLTMLNSCAPGVAVVNIDNGYGAGHMAAQIAAPVRD